jgi:hypothetical protein
MKSSAHRRPKPGGGGGTSKSDPARALLADAAAGRSRSTARAAIAAPRTPRLVAVDMPDLLGRRTRVAAFYSVLGTLSRL